MVLRSAFVRSRVAQLILAAGALAVCSGVASAQTWNGLSGATSTWTDGLNWAGGIVPVNAGTASLTFTGNSRTNNFLGGSWDVFSITFNSSASAFTLNGSGNTLTLRAGGIFSTDLDPQTLAISTIVVASGQTWQTTAGPLQVNGQQITLNSPLNLSASGGGSISIASQFAGTSVLNKLGTGTLTLSPGLAASTNTGLFSIIQGTAQTTSANVLSDVAPVSVSSGATLLLGGNDTIPSLGGGTSSTVDLGASTLTISHDSANTIVFNGNAIGTGGITKSGTYIQTLSGNNTYTGTTTVNGGTLRIGSSERLADASDLSVSGTGIFDLQNFTETVDQVSLAGPGQIGLFGSAGFLNANAFNLQSGTCRAALGGPGGIIKTTASNMFLQSANSTYTGNTVISDGLLVVNADAALSPNSPITINPPGVLRVINFANTVPSITGTGNIEVINATLTIGAGNASSTVNGIISDTGFAGSITKIGTGTLTLNNSNTYQGTTTINAGSLRLNAAERLANISDVVLNNGQLFVSDETIEFFTMAAGELRAIDPGARLFATIYVCQSGFSDCVLAGPGGLFKTGSGTLSLRASNTHAFSQIDSGVLEIDTGAALGTGICILNGGTLRVLETSTFASPVSVTQTSTIECLMDVLVSDVSGNAGRTLTKSGPGTLTLGPVNSFGHLNVIAGGLALGATGVNVQSLTVAATGRASLDGTLLTTSSVANSGTLELSLPTRIIANTFSNSGVLSGSGRVQSPFANDATGDVRIGNGGSMHFASTSAFANAGLVEVIGGSLEVDGAFTNSASTGLLFARNATLRFDGGLLNQGSLACSFGITDIFGDITNPPGGIITITGGSDATFVDDVTNNGSIRTSAGGASVFLGAVSGSGSFPGSGTVFLEGDLRPGNSPGLVSFGGDVVFGSFANLTIELGGTDPNQFDRAAVAGVAHLDGLLDVRLIDGFTPGRLQSFTIITAGEVSGRFAEVSLPPSSPPLVVQYSGTTVRITTCPAEFNDDGELNADDLADFINCYFTLPPCDRADFNSDLDVNADDLGDYINAYFAGC